MLSVKSEMVPPRISFTYGRVYSRTESIPNRTMSIDDAVDEALETDGMSRREEDEEAGRLVASLQD